MQRDVFAYGTGAQDEGPRRKLFIFSFDNVLVEGSSTKTVMASFGMQEKLENLRGLYNGGKISGRKFVRSLAALLKGKKVRDFDRAAATLRPRKQTLDELRKLRNKGCKLAVVSFSFRRTIYAALPKSLLDFVIAPALKIRNGVLTGEVEIPPYRSSRHVFSKRAAVLGLMKKVGASTGETLAVGQSRWDSELYSTVGAAVDVATSEQSPLAGIDSIA